MFSKGPGQPFHPQAAMRGCWLLSWVPDVCQPAWALLSDSNPPYSPGAKPHSGRQSPLNLTLKEFPVSSTVSPLHVPKVGYGN